MAAKHRLLMLVLPVAPLHAFGLGEPTLHSSVSQLPREEAIRLQGVLEMAWRERRMATAQRPVPEPALEPMAASGAGQREASPTSAAVALAGTDELRHQLREAMAVNQTLSAENRLLSQRLLELEQSLGQLVERLAVLPLPADAAPRVEAEPGSPPAWWNLPYVSMGLLALLLLTTLAGGLWYHRAQRRDAYLQFRDLGR